MTLYTTVYISIVL